MNLKQKITYLKKMRTALLISKNSGQKYSVSEIMDFVGLNMLPPTPLYKNAKPNISSNKSSHILIKRCNSRRLRVR